MNLQGPIIIIGCGRSGSTLLDRVLNAHPSIHMLGETNFLTSKIWDTLHKSSRGSLWNAAARRSYQNKIELKSKEKKYAHVRFPTYDEWNDEESSRVARIVNSAVTDLFALNSIDKKFWGMKEIWNGGAFDVDWEIYDKVYPESYWVHLVRNPLGYLRSALGWNNLENTYESMRNQLENWYRILIKSRERSSLPRYVEIRYEDLLENPQVTLSKLFGFIGITWSHRCLQPIRQNWVATEQLPNINMTMFCECVKSLGLSETLDELGYTLDVQDLQPLTTYSKSVSYNENGNIDISSWVHEGIGLYWLFTLSTAPAVRDVLKSDCGNLPSLNQARIFEDGIPLARWSDPSTFSLSPLGSFFCNPGSIIFTTPDGSDPLTNGRCYTLSFD